MKTLTATSIAALASIFIVSGPAQAADIYTKPSEAYAGAGPVKMNWSGVYISGSIGYGNANHDLSVRDYFKEFCSDETADENFDPFEDGDRVRTLENKNAEYAALNEPDWFKNALVRSDCSTRAGHTNSPDISGDRDIPTETGDLTVPADSREIANLDGLNSTGVVGDIRLGYDQQMGRFVLGVFGSYGFSGMEADGASIGGAFTDFNLERGDDWSIGARAGMLVNDRTLLYILAAYTETEYDFSGTFNGEAFSQDTTFSGVTVGGGVEFALNEGIFLGFEGTHTFYDGETIFDDYDPATNVGTLIHDDLGETKLLATIKLKLNGSLLGN